MPDPTPPEPKPGELIEKNAEWREELVRRICAVMGWDYKTAPVWTGIRKVALAEATPVGFDKMDQIITTIQSLRARVAELEQKCAATRCHLNSFKALCEGQGTAIQSLQARVTELEQRKPAAVVLSDCDDNHGHAFEDYDDAMEFNKDRDMYFVPIGAWTWHPKPERGEAT